MHLLGLVKSIDHVCCRYRLAAFEPSLAKAGHELELRAWPHSLFGRMWFHRTLRQADAVIVQRRLLSPWEVPLLRRAARKVIFDFDDAVFLRSSYAPSGPVSATRMNGFTRTVRAADLVIAGNDFLASRVATEIGAANLQVVPTCVEPSRYPLATHSNAGSGVRLAWIGSSSTLKGLRRSAPLWEEIGRRCSGVTLKLICDNSLSFNHLAVDFCPWSEETEASELANADIGISWLPDDYWSRGKCGLKLLQYMAAGLPVVANAVGVQAEIVRHGKNGFLVQTPDQWCEAVHRLAADPALRRRMGQEGRRVVEREYSVAAGGARLLAALDQLMAKPARWEAAA